VDREEAPAPWQTRELLACSPDRARFSWSVAVSRRPPSRAYPPSVPRRRRPALLRDDVRCRAGAAREPGGKAGRDGVVGRGGGVADAAHRGRADARPRAPRGTPRSGAPCRCGRRHGRSRRAGGDGTAHTPPIEMPIPKRRQGRQAAHRPGPASDACLAEHADVGLVERRGTPVIDDHAPGRPVRPTPRTPFRTAADPHRPTPRATPGRCGCPRMSRS